MPPPETVDTGTETWDCCQYPPLHSDPRPVIIHSPAHGQYCQPSSPTQLITLSHLGVNQNFVKSFNQQIKIIFHPLIQVAPVNSSNKTSENQTIFFKFPVFQHCFSSSESSKERTLYTALVKGLLVVEVGEQLSSLL